MFITRASRHDKGDIGEFLERHGWPVGDIDQGVFFFARDGAIAGSVRFIEVAPQTLVVQDMVVERSRRGQGIGKELLEGAMSNRGGTLYLRCLDDLSGYYTSHFSFVEVEEPELPDGVRAHFEAAGPLGGDARYLKAR